MFDILLDALPQEIHSCPIKSGHKDVLRMLKSMEEAKTPEEKLTAFFSGLFIDKFPVLETPELFDEFWKNEIDPFLSGGNVPHYKSNGKQTVDYTQDADVIFASFFQAYKIDLNKENYHWYVFVSLFNGLPEETPMKKLMELRSWKPSKNDSKEYIKEMRERQIRARIRPRG